MNVLLAFAGDFGLNEHWQDALLAALLALGVWFIERGISRMEKRHERAEGKFEKIDDRLSDHHARLAVVEADQERQRRFPVEE